MQFLKNPRKKGIFHSKQKDEFVRDYTALFSVLSYLRGFNQKNDEIATFAFAVSLNYLFLAIRAIAVDFGIVVVNLEAGRLFDRFVGLVIRAAF